MIAAAVWVAWGWLCWLAGWAWGAASVLTHAAGVWYLTGRAHAAADALAAWWERRAA